MSFFDKIREGMSKTRGKLNVVFANFRKVDEDLMEELEEALILCDMGVNTTEEVMEELRALNMAFQKQSNNKWQQRLVIETMAAIEEETHLDEFLDAHATEIDLTKEELLISRYVYLADGEKLKPLRQRRLWNAVCKLCPARVSCLCPCIPQLPDPPG